MEEPQSYEEMKRQSAAFDSRLRSLDRRLAALEAARPPLDSDRRGRRNQDRWQKKMTALTRQGKQWGQDYLEFLRVCEPLLTEWATRDPGLQDELTEWRESLRQMENSVLESASWMAQSVK